MEEQALLTKLQNALLNNETINASEIATYTNFLRKNNSVLINYHLGVYFKTTDETKSQSYLRKAIEIEPKFTAPYYDLADFYETLPEKEKILMKIFNVPTIDFTTQRRTKRIALEDIARIAFILVPLLAKEKNFTKIINIHKILSKQYSITSPNKIKNDTNYVLTWKFVHQEAGQSYFYSNRFEEANEAFSDGLMKYGLCSKDNYFCDKSLIMNLQVNRQYSDIYYNLPMKIDDFYDTIVTEKLTKVKYLPKSDKIRIGYITPDLNKNAVSLFMSHFFKYYTTDKFEVYVFYTRNEIDQYTELFKSYKVTKWFDTHSFTDLQTAKLIASLSLDVLVDLIGPAVGNSMIIFKLLKNLEDFSPGKSLEQVNPRPIIITYLGFPDTTMFSAIDYRLVDKITDPEKADGITEKLIRLPRCFICFSPFDIEKVPEINYSSGKEIRIGIFNKITKHSASTIKDWKDILTRLPNAKLYIKADEKGFTDPDLIYKDLPADQIVHLSFQNVLYDYYDHFNLVDFCIDTFPYSGTTTTCSSLYMGVPTFTKYDQKNRHVSNVSASILKHSGFNDYVLSTEEYVDKIVEYAETFKDSNILRNERRTQFMSTMNPREFMADFENEIIKLLKKSKKVTFAEVEIPTSRPGRVIKITSEQIPKNTTKPTQKKIILFEGWRYLLHSYSVVMNYQLINIDQTKYTVYVKEVKYFKDHWKPDTSFKMWPEKYRTILSCFKELPSDVTPDIIYRISFPYNIEPVPNTKTLVFYTAEYSALNPEYFVGNYKSMDQIIKKINDNNITMTGPSKWSINSLKLPSSKNILIPHGIDTSMIIKSKAYRNYYREQYGIADTDILLLSIGCMAQNKGISHILYTIHKLYTNGHTNYKLFLKGSDSLYDSKMYVDKLLDDLITRGLVKNSIEETKKQIIYIGNMLPFSDTTCLSIFGLYNIADYYISPYIAEGFNLPVLEALSSGLKTLIPKTGSTSDFHEDFPGLAILLNSEIIKNIDGRFENKIDYDECYHKLISDKNTEKYHWKNITGQLTDKFKTIAL